MKAMFLIITLSGFFLLSCGDKIGAGKDDWYYIYITGDTGRTVKISYLERPAGVELPEENVTITESVTLPFFKEVHTIDWPEGLGPDNFLEINTQNDSTTKAIIFDDELPLSDGKCGVMIVFYPENAVDECTYCDSYPKDSILAYFKSVSYPCYLEFSNGETVKKVRLHDWWYKGH